MNSYLTVDISKDCRLDELLRQQFFFSRHTLYLCKKEGRLVLNGTAVLQDCDLHPGDRLLFYYQKEEPLNCRPIEFDLKILYEDDLILVVDKPIGYIIHSDGTEQCRNENPQNVNNFVAWYYKKTGQKHGVYNLHRLDRDTSGCLLYCKESLMVACFSHAMETKAIKRTYLAKVEGIMRKSRIIDKPIGRDRHVSNRFRVSATGKAARTEVTPLKHDKTSTLVECRLATGRTHQIRVHLASIGHPIVGDVLYGAKENKRLMLHSHKVEFFSPLVNEMITVTCPAEDSFTL
jgi:23S rRNA pseudouridine1911/1915/1917 synthase